MIKITEGRQQPYAVWKVTRDGRPIRLLRFFDSYMDALAYDEEMNGAPSKTG